MGQKEPVAKTDISLFLNAHFCHSINILPAIWMQHQNTRSQFMFAFILIRGLKRSPPSEFYHHPQRWNSELGVIALSPAEQADLRQTFQKTLKLIIIIIIIIVTANLSVCFM